MPRTFGDFQFFDVREIAKIMGVKERTITQWLRIGKLNGKKFGGKWYATQEAIREAFDPKYSSQPAEPTKTKRSAPWLTKEGREKRKKEQEQGGGGST